MRKYKFPEWQLLTTSIIIYHIPVEFSNLIACVLDWLLYKKNKHRLEENWEIYRHFFDERLSKTIRHSISKMDKIGLKGLFTFFKSSKKNPGI